jgi:hypothetical protein
MLLTPQGERGSDTASDWDLFTGAMNCIILSIPFWFVVAGIVAWRSHRDFACDSFVIAVALSLAISSEMLSSHKLLAWILRFLAAWAGTTVLVRLLEELLGPVVQ